MLQFLELFALPCHLGYLHFVQSSGGLLAVAGNEGYGGAFVQQVQRLFRLAQAYAQGLGYESCYFLHDDRF